MLDLFISNFLDKKRGVALFFSLAVCFFVFMMICSISILSRGEIEQLGRTDDNVRALLLCRAAYQEVVARLNSGTWEERFFKDEPFIETGVKYGSGEYDLFVSDVAGEEYSADIFVTARVGKVARSVFYRINYVESFFDELNRIRPVFVADAGELTEQEADTDISLLSANVSELITKRKENEQLKAEKLRAIASKNEINDIMNTLSMGGGDVLRASTSFTPFSSVPEFQAGGPETPDISELMEKYISTGIAAIDFPFSSSCAYAEQSSYSFQTKESGSDATGDSDDSLSGEDEDTDLDEDLMTASMLTRAVVDATLVSVAREGTSSPAGAVSAHAAGITTILDGAMRMIKERPENIFSIIAQIVDSVISFGVTQTASMIASASGLLKETGKEFAGKNSGGGKNEGEENEDSSSGGDVKDELKDKKIFNFPPFSFGYHGPTKPHPGEVNPAGQGESGPSSQGKPDKKSKKTKGGKDEDGPHHHPHGPHHGPPHHGGTGKKGR